MNDNHIREENGVQIIDDARWDSENRDRYIVKAGCTNCGWEGGLERPKGYTRPYGYEVCPTCECRSVLTSSILL